MKIKRVANAGKLPVYDLSINSDNYDEQQYVLKNGVISHNTGIYYSSNEIWVIGRQQQKQGTEVTGYNFVINIEKSRRVKEKRKIPITVTWDGGIEKYSGLLELALAGAYVAKPSNGWYQHVDTSTGEMVGPKYREKDTLSAEFWDPIFNNTNFKEFIKGYYQIGYAPVKDVELDIEVEDE